VFGNVAAFLLIGASSTLLIRIAAEGVIERRAEAVVLVVERTGICQIIDLAEHLERQCPARRQLVFQLPSVLEAQGFLVGEIATLLCEKRIQCERDRPLDHLNNRAKRNLIGIALDHGLLIARLEGESDPISLPL
jgi:hypothetical protein